MGVREGGEVHVFFVYSTAKAMRLITGKEIFKAQAVKLGIPKRYQPG